MAGPELHRPEFCLKRGAQGSDLFYNDPQRQRSVASPIEKDMPCKSATLRKEKHTTTLCLSGLGRDDAPPHPGDNDAPSTQAHHNKATSGHVEMLPSTPNVHKAAKSLTSLEPISAPPCCWKGHYVGVLVVNLQEVVNQRCKENTRLGGYKA